MDDPIRFRHVVRVVGPSQGGRTLVRSPWSELWIDTDLIPFDLRGVGSVFVLIEREGHGPRLRVERAASGERPAEASNVARPVAWRRRPWDA